MKVNLFCEQIGIKHKNPTVNLELDVIQKVMHSLFIVHGENNVNILDLYDRGSPQASLFDCVGLQKNVSVSKNSKLKQNKIENWQSNFGNDHFITNFYMKRIQGVSYIVILGLFFKGGERGGSKILG